MRDDEREEVIGNPQDVTFEAVDDRKIGYQRARAEFVRELWASSALPISRQADR